ncbi:hypothetical protein [Methanopyrus sp.]
MSERDAKKYDMIIPLGVPADVIAEVERRCDVKVVQREIERGGTKTTVLAFRGTKEALKEAKKVMEELIERRVEEWTKPRRHGSS